MLFIWTNSDSAESRSGNVQPKSETIKSLVDTIIKHYLNWLRLVAIAPKRIYYMRGTFPLPHENPLFGQRSVGRRQHDDGNENKTISRIELCIDAITTHANCFAQSFRCMMSCEFVCVGVTPRGNRVEGKRGGIVFLLRSCGWVDRTNVFQVIVECAVCAAVEMQVVFV